MAHLDESEDLPQSGLSALFLPLLPAEASRMNFSIYFMTLDFYIYIPTFSLSLSLSLFLYVCMTDCLTFLSCSMSATLSHKDLAGLAGCSALAFVLYLNTLNAGFVYDDR